MSNGRTTILQWAGSNHLAAPNVDSAIKHSGVLPNNKDWSLFISQLMIWLASISLGSGAIFFLAYNWNDMSRFSKFSLVELAMLASTAFYFFLATQNTTKAAALFLIALLTGALLALVGQTYQTGADPWQLFAVWSALIFPLALVSRSSSLWLLWSALVNLSVFLYQELHQGIFGFVFNEQNLFWMFGCINTLLLLLLELISSKEQASRLRVELISITNRIAAQLVSLFAGFFVTCIAFIAIFDFTLQYGWGLLAYIIWMSVAFCVYRYHSRDLLLLSACALSAIAVATALLIKALEDAIGDGGFLVLTVAVIGLSSMAAIWLKKLSNEFSASPEEQASGSEEQTSSSIGGSLK